MCVCVRLSAMASEIYHIQKSKKLHEDSPRQVLMHLRLRLLICKSANTREHAQFSAFRNPQAKKMESERFFLLRSLTAGMGGDVVRTIRNTGRRDIIKFRPFMLKLLQRVQKYIYNNPFKEINCETSISCFFSPVFRTSHTPK